VLRRKIQPGSLSTDVYRPKLNWLFRDFCRAFFKAYCPMSVSGRELLPKPPFIICSNHSSHMDSPALMNATRLPFENFGMIAAKDYFFAEGKKNNIAHLFMNLIPISRKTSRTSIHENLIACRKFIKAGEKNLIIYPEGTRSVTGQMRPFKRGAALIAVELRIPIVPAYISGTYQAMRKGQFFPRMRRLKVTIGKPIMPEVFGGYDTSTDKNRLSRQVAKELEEKIHKLKESHNV